MPPVCAIASTMRTPGITGWPGKWPSKNQSLTVFQALLASAQWRPLSLEDGYALLQKIVKEFEAKHKVEVDLSFTAQEDLLKKITAKLNAVEQQFNVFRAKVDGQELSDSKVRAILKDGGSALIGIGRASGEDRAVEAARG